VAGVRLVEFHAVDDDGRRGSGTQVVADSTHHRHGRRAWTTGHPATVAPGRVPATKVAPGRVPTVKRDPNAHVEADCHEERHEEGAESRVEHVAGCPERRALVIRQARRTIHHRQEVLFVGTASKSI